MKHFALFVTFMIFFGSITDSYAYRIYIKSPHAVKWDAQCDGEYKSASGDEDITFEHECNWLSVSAQLAQSCEYSGMMNGIEANDLCNADQTAQFHWEYPCTRSEDTPNELFFDYCR